MENNVKQEPTKNLKVASDWGKLELSGEDIYKFKAGKYPYNALSSRVNERILQENFNAKLIDSEIDETTGFAAYAFKDNETGEIVITYVGTEDGTDAITDGEIGVHNITNANKIVLGNVWNHDLMVKQYDQGDSFYMRMRHENPSAKISVTGHSLGGGIADAVALRHQEDNIEALTLNPAPVLDRDVEKFGDGFDMKNIRNIINENDPLHIGINVGDFITPGRMYKIPNGAGHSYAFTKDDYDKSGHLVWTDKLVSDNDTGWDLKPGFLEISNSTGALYTGIVHDKFKRKVSTVEEAVGGTVIKGIINTPPIAAFIGMLTAYSDAVEIGVKIEEGLSELNQTYENMKSKITSEAIKFSIAATIEIKSAVDTAVDWIETTLAKCKEKVLEVLESVFNVAVDFLAGSVNVYLAASEILEIAKEVAGSYIQDLLDMFKGDFQIDTNVTAIVAEHILAHRHSLLNLFMNDSSRGINRSLLGEISKDVKELSKDLKQLNEDVSEAVFSMMAKDEELGAVAYY
ncbi:lipase family protein [Bacillus cytotoxicus]|uniref:lipase family protein n=1 Tax=Bacillus cytotoxicus TaxID=580165 RepID=UPI0006611F65|nr:lipase [Bacillus cytotoxicus]AWC32527.1 lipase [Bacillus cytotoxicus]AWC36555.1 lipase [Bacillus cytotoxicus]AWC60809.1 lipase [Bacillus cytotoxicus]KMT50999.1 lipase [Bacillus cytotoxicus]HDR7308699.1 lipase [Bacillus cytotoxicus]